MKKISSYFLSILAAFILLSCGVTKTQELVSESSDKSNQVKLSGKRETSFDPFQTTVIINGFGQTDTLITEIFAKDLKKETVSFLWADNNSCTITFIQQDDSKRVMELFFSKDGNSLKEPFTDGKY
jgi:hypothetical protein